MRAPSHPGSVTSVFGKAIALVAGAIVLVLGFMFSLLLVAFVVVVGLVVLGWFWWKTRALRKAMRTQAPLRERAGDGQVIDGESVVVEEFQVTRGIALPDEPQCRHGDGLLHSAAESGGGTGDAGDATPYPVRK